MEMVVKIPDDMIKSLEQGSFGAKYSIHDLVGYLMNGTPLPKGHGRIGDLDRLYNVFEKNVVSADAFKELFDHAPTIIEADKEE